jgi:putative transposase
MKKLWGRKVSDLGLHQLLKILEFKAIEHKKTLGFVSRFYPSSKTCSLCHNVKENLSLKERVYKCENCTLEIDRDLNAAINILREGASSLGLDGVSRDSYDLVSVA